MKIGDLVRVRAHTRWSAKELPHHKGETPEGSIDWGLGIITDLYALDSTAASGPHFKVQFDTEYCWFEDYELEVISKS